MLPLVLPLLIMAIVQTISHYFWIVSCRIGRSFWSASIVTAIDLRWSWAIQTWTVNNNVCIDSTTRFCLNLNLISTGDSIRLPLSTKKYRSKRDCVRTWQSTVTLSIFCANWIENLITFNTSQLSDSPLKSA